VPEQTLHERRVLVAEDEFLLARDLRLALADRGANVIGPAASLAKVIDLIQAEARIDGAILDVNLRGETVYAAADLLRERGIPFLFTTGYDLSSLPERFRDVVRCEKPADPGVVLGALNGLLRA
jgi:CheY-like chemotaxis protein